MNELVPISWISRFTATLSMIGSSSIIYMIVSDRKRKLVRPYQRLMLLMSIFDVLQSIAFVINVTAFPQESDVYGAHGNALTCTVEGFIGTLGLAVPIYNLNLNIFYVLTIRYRFSSDQYAKFEPAVHAVSILVPLFIAIISVAYYDIMPRGPVCYARGRNLPLNLSMLTVFICFLGCLLCMVSICLTVTSQTKRMEKYTNHSRRSRMSRMEDDKRKTINQACTYTLAFILTYAFPALLHWYVRGRGLNGVKAPYALMILTCIFFPLQGFWNLLFYVRPGVQFIMEGNPDMSYIRAIRNVILNPETVPSRRRRSLVRTPINKGTPVSARFPVPLCETNDGYSKDTLNTRGLKIISDESNAFEKETKGLAVTPSSGAPTPCECTKDLEHQPEDRSRSTAQVRRLSLMHVGSILNDADFVDNDDGHDSEDSEDSARKSTMSLDSEDSACKSTMSMT